MITIEIWDKTILDEVKRLDERRQGVEATGHLQFILGALTAFRWILDRKISPSVFAEKTFL
jgi:hypothetical protein